MKHVVLGMLKTRAPGFDPDKCFRSALGDLLAIWFSWGFKGLYIPPCLGSEEEGDALDMLLGGHTCIGASDGRATWLSASEDTATGAISCEGAHCDICIARLGGRIDSFLRGVTTKMKVVGNEKADD